MITATEVLVADECWIALALLHRNHPERASFSAREILDRVKLEEIHDEVRAGIQPHIYRHNVANLAPNSAQYRMFYKLEDGSFRLFKPSDDFHPTRSGKTKPNRSDLPPHFHYLLDWYERDYCSQAARPNGDLDFVLQMRGLGKEIWSDMGGDAFVEGLRADWPDDSPPVKDSSRLALQEKVWNRVLTHQKEEFHTRTRLPFTYSVDGKRGVWFYRKGRRIEKRLGRGDLEKAVARCPLKKTTDIKDCFDSAYLFALLMDSRIRDKDW